MDVRKILTDAGFPTGPEAFERCVAAVEKAVDEAGRRRRRDVLHRVLLDARDVCHETCAWHEFPDVPGHIRELYRRLEESEKLRRRFENAVSREAGASRQEGRHLTMEYEVKLTLLVDEGVSIDQVERALTPSMDPVVTELMLVSFVQGVIYKVAQVVSDPPQTGEGG